MLETLDTIDWAHIQHSHGPATAFPTWIRQLRSDIPEIRASARENLFEYSFHQTSIYEVTAYLVPFLIELAAATDTPERGRLLRHLSYLASASAGMERETRYGGNPHNTHTNAQAGEDIYLALLDDPEPEVRLGAFSVLTALKSSGTLWTTVERLVGVASRETNSENLADMIDLLLGYVYDHVSWRPPEPAVKNAEALLVFIASLLSPERAPRVRFRAALAHLALAGQARAETAITIAGIMQDVLMRPDAYCQDATRFRAEWEIKQALKALEYLPRARRLAILTEALGAAAYAQDAHLLGRALLDTLFFGMMRADSKERYHPHPYIERGKLTEKHAAERPENADVPFRKDIHGSSNQARYIGKRYLASAPPADLSALSAEDRKLLRLVLDAEMVWAVWSNLLEVYGLPAHRDDARALLDAADAGQLPLPGTHM